MAQGSPNTAEKLLETQQRRREVLQLKEAGATYEAIADALLQRHGAEALPNGWDRRYAYKDLQRELEKLQAENREAAENVRRVELRRLDRMLRGLWKDATEGDTQAIRAALKIMKRRADLLGLDAPERFEQAVSFAESEEYQRARAEIMQALRDFPEARAALAETLTEEANGDDPTA